MNLLCCPPNRTQEIWPIAESYVYSATDRGTWSRKRVRDEVFTGDALLWLAVEDDNVHGAGVTQLVDGVCEIVAWGADDLTKTVHLLNVIEDYARAEKCRAVRLIGRKGWSRKLQGYKTMALVMERPL